MSTVPSQLGLTSLGGLPLAGAGTAAVAAGEASGAVRLVDLPLRREARVVAVLAPQEAHDPAIVERLAEIGFIPGERVRVIGRAVLGGPLAVRVGTGTFALRRSEARCIAVQPEAATERA